MSQDVSTNQGVIEPLTSSPPIQPWSAESEADKLMDELFSDIDRILEGGSKLPTEPAKPEYISLKPIVIPQIAMSPIAVPPQELVQQPSTEPITVTSVEPSEPREAQTASPRTARSGWSFEKILLAGGIASLIFTVIVLLISQQRLSWPWSLNLTGSPSVPKSKLSEADAQFVSYMLRSLEVIDNKTKAKQQQSPASGSSGTTNQPSNSATGNRTLGSNQGPTVLERVYIPVPQPQQPLALPAPPAAARPSIPAPSVAAARPSIPAPPAARPAAPAPAAARPAVPTPAAARPSAPVSPQSTASAPTPRSAAATTSAATPPPAPAANHTLVGLLELGDRSAALFEINGNTQRINVGEAIGASGWALVSVANQEAVVRRNGEVRSVYVGQKF